MDMNFENRFWLQILGDHMRFLEKALPVKEEKLLEKVLYLKDESDRLFAGALVENLEIKDILTLVKNIKNLKLDILHRQLVGEVEINLPPTFINHMLSDTEAYEKILMNPDVTPHILEEHYLWQNDAKGHAIPLIQTLDPTEKKIMTDF